MNMKKHEYEVVGSKDTVIAKVWWDGEKIDSDSQNYLKSLKGKNIGIYTVKDGEKFMENFPKLYSNGYIRVRSVK